MPYLYMKPILKAHVAGVAVPQGSMRAGRSGQLFYSNAAKLKPWRTLITDAVEALLPRGHRPIETPVSVTVTFYLPRPKTVARFYPTAPPDLDKLIRAVGDALTASDLYKDDSYVVEWKARKLYATETESAGVTIEVHHVTERSTVDMPRLW